MIKVKKILDRQLKEASTQLYSYKFALMELGIFLGFINFLFQGKKIFFVIHYDEVTTSEDYFLITITFIPIIYCLHWIVLATQFDKELEWSSIQTKLLLSLGILVFFIGLDSSINAIFFSIYKYKEANYQFNVILTEDWIFGLLYFLTGCLCILHPISTLLAIKNIYKIE